MRVSTTDPSALRSASTKARSDAGSEGVTEIDVEHDVAGHRRAYKLPQQFGMKHGAGQGQTPIFSIEGASIATTTMSPLASCDSQPEPQIRQCVAQAAMPAA